MAFKRIRRARFLRFTVLFPLVCFAGLVWSQPQTQPSPTQGGKAILKTLLGKPSNRHLDEARFEKVKADYVAFLLEAESDEQTATFLFKNNTTGKAETKAAKLLNDLGVEDPESRLSGGETIPFQNSAFEFVTSRPTEETIQVTVRRK